MYNIYYDGSIGCYVVCNNGSISCLNALTYSEALAETKGV